MIDMFALLVSTGMMAIVVFFAIRGNRERPWFEGGKPARPVPNSGTAVAPRRPPLRTPVRRSVRR